MSRSKYADRFASGRSVLNEIRDGQLGRLERTERQSDRQKTLEDWADLAKSEAGVKERYRGRYLFELLQNANDAIIDAGNGTNGGAPNHLVRLELTPKSLLVANYGMPFSRDNVEALCRLHKTTKSASKQIGHKGIGFKSVLEISPRPEVYSLGEQVSFAFGFDGDQFRNEVGKIMGAASDYQYVLPTLRTPNYRDLRQLPAHDRARIEELFDSGYVTVVRLPWEDDEVAEAVASRLADDIQPSLLLFMTGISQIEICYKDGHFQYFRRELRPGVVPAATEVILYEGDDKVEREHSRWLVLAPSSRFVQDRSLVKDLGEAWQDVTSLRFSIAFPAEKHSGKLLCQDVSQLFYVYFPTQEFSGLRFAIHADFHVSDDRKHLERNNLNDWLIEQICEYIAADGVEALKVCGASGADLVALLAPISYQESLFVKYFVNQYLQWLSIAQFVQTDGNKYRSPSECRFPPETVEESQFRQLFPAGRVRGSDSWAYPLCEIVAAERSRSTAFLLRDDLGGHSICLQDVVVWLASVDPMPLEKCGELIGFLSDWWDKTHYYERKKFQESFADLQILPTSNGWLTPKDLDETLVFQANLRTDVPDLLAPAGFDFAVIMRTAYPPENAARSNQARFIEALGVREYSKRGLIASAILPVLTNSERFNELKRKYPHSIADAFRILKDYYDAEGSTATFDARLSHVLVPAFSHSSSANVIWREASACYLGPDWPSGETIHFMYSQFDDCWFCGSPAQLGIEEGEDLNSWVSFLLWLGVEDKPRVVTICSGSYSLDMVKNPAPVAEWREYTRALGAECHCPKYHVRNVSSVVRLHHLDDFIRDQDASKLVMLYRYLSENWNSFYRKRLFVNASCGYSRCSGYDEVPSIAMVALRNQEWIPALVAGGMTLAAAKHIWVLGETEPTDVRHLVPTLPEELRNVASHQFERDLSYQSPSTATIDDYIELLQQFPERYTLELGDGSEEISQPGYRSVRAVFNWVCDRIQTGLANRITPVQPPPKGLCVVANRNGRLCYVPIGTPELVFPDDRRLAERWKENCAQFSVNDDWTRLRSWLNIPNLSKLIDSEWHTSGVLEQETALLRQEIDRTLPYYLALIKASQPANYTSLLGRLKRLNVQVCERLEVEERMSCLPDSPLKTVPEIVRLVRSEVDTPRERSYGRIGTLYATPAIFENPDLLGDLMADYVDILRLGDAFVLLFGRKDEADKRRYLTSKGIDSETLREVFSDLEQDAGEGGDAGDATRIVQQLTWRSLKTMMSQTPSQYQDNAGAIHVLDLSPASANSGDSASTSTSSHALPPLDLSNVPPPLVPDRFAPPAATASKPFRHDSTSNSNSHMPDPDLNRNLGQQGEKWAFQAEKARLAKLGLDVDHLVQQGKLMWVSEREPLASYDIRSVDISLDGSLNTVYIEVKSSSGTGRYIHLSLQELELAINKGEDYWLYWVGNVDTEQPNQPITYKNLAKLLADGLLDVHLEKLAITLPESEQ